MTALPSRQVWLYRHAESLANAGGRTHDPAHIPLTPKGRQQAARLAARMGRAPDRIATSAFLRSRQTAEPIAARFETADLTTWDVHEFVYLDPERCIDTTWIERKPMVDAYWARMDPDHRDGANTESFRDLLDRAQSFLAQIARADPPLEICVSHGQFMQAVFLVHDQTRPDALKIMQDFHFRQLRSPFANCERLRLRIELGRVAGAVRG